MSNNPSANSEEIVFRFTREPKEMVGNIEREKLLRAPSAENSGIFNLLKSELVMKGKTVSVDRCDELTYSAISLYNETPELQGENLIFGKKIPYRENEIFGLNNVMNVYTFLEIPGKFCLSYMEFCEPDENGKIVSSARLEKGPWAGSLNYSRTMGELFKTIREWSFMLEPPFSLTGHPMAVWSKIVFDELNPPKEILDEIDSYPDMHLVRYLKGDESHRELNTNFPEMSELMKNWIVSIVENNPKQNIIKLIDDL